jgi:hypothetical protein
MPKTKARAKTSSKLETKKEIKQTACNSACWLCWLFKLMLAMFVVMIIFWLGFCFGAISWQTPVSQSYGLMSTAKQTAQNMCLNAPVDTIASNMTATLQNKQGDDFDKEWLLQMSIQNQGAIEMSKLALEKSARADLKKLAQDIIDFNQKGIDKMKNWQSTWFKTQ